MTASVEVLFHAHHNASTHETNYHVSILQLAHVEVTLGSYGVAYWRPDTGDDLVSLERIDSIKRVADGSVELGRDGVVIGQIHRQSASKAVFYYIFHAVQLATNGSLLLSEEMGLQNPAHVVSEKVKPYCNYFMSSFTTTGPELPMGFSLTRTSSPTPSAPSSWRTLVASVITPSMQASQHNNQEKLKTHEFNMGVLEAIGASVLILCIVSIICCRFQRVCCMTKNSVHPSVSSIMKMAVQDQYLIGQNEIQQVQDVRATDNMFKVCTGVLHQSVVVALKTMSVDGHPEVTPILETTLRSLSRLRHPNLALFLGILVDPDPKVSRLTLIHEWAPGPSLEIFLQDVPLSASCNSILALGIGQAMHYLHSQRPPALQHDLLPANIIVSSPKYKPKAMIISYGLGALHEVVHKAKGLEHQAPSIHADHQAFSRILALLWAQARAPCKMDELIRMMRQQLPEQRAASRIEMMSACFHPDLSVRPSILDILNFLEQEIEEKREESEEQRN